MQFLTKGEFIQALKDYNVYISKTEKLKDEYKNLHYLRYEKIKSPLDYDIVGYDNKGDPIRQIKSRAYLSDEQIASNNEILDKRIDDCLEEISYFTSKVINIDDELTRIEKPLRDILIMRYKNHLKLKDVCKKFDDMYLDEAGMYKYIMRGLDKYYEN